FFLVLMLVRSLRSSLFPYTTLFRSIDWKKKLSSRKFWAAIIGFVSPLLLAFGLGEGTVTEITGIIMSAGTLIAYIISEGFVDARSEEHTSELQSRFELVCRLLLEIK